MIVTRQREIEVDLHSAAIHEAGHAIVFDHFSSGKSYIEVYFNDSQGKGESLVLGRFGYFPPLNSRQDRIFGVAGNLAEHIASCLHSDQKWQWDNVYDARQFIDDQNFSTWSDTDLSSFRRLTEKQINICAAILVQDWSRVVDEAVHVVAGFRDRHADDADLSAAVDVILPQLNALRHPQQEAA